MRKNLRQISGIILSILFLIGIGLFDLDLIVAQENNIPPALFFSDLESGAKTGWGGSATKGVSVTVWGRNFGTTRGTSYITVNGAQITQDSDYAEWGVNGGGIAEIPGLKRITFWLNSNCQDGVGTIIVTVNGQISNSLPFTVRTGNIYFVDANSPNNPGSGTYNDPWRSPASFYANMVPGDTCYFRQGTYDGEYGYGQGSWHSNICIAKSGTSGNPIAFLGYPGETATFDAYGPDDPIYNFRKNGGQHIVVAKLRLLAYRFCIHTGSNWRVVGNYCNGIHVLTAAGVIIPSGDNIAVYGNEITGGSSGNKLDHAIYPNGGTNIDIGWNYIHDNNFYWGPMISNNHDNAYNDGTIFDNIHIHDNIIDVAAYPSRAIGIFETGAGSDFHIYNNVIIGGAPSSLASVYGISGELYIWNNSFYDVNNAIQTYSITIHNHTYIPDFVSIINNIIQARPGSYYINISSASTPTIDSNCYYGNGAYNGGDDANMVNADPQFVNPSAGDLRLQPDSPCIDKGSSLVSAIVQTDHNGVIRPQGSAYDIGAYEYVPQGASQPVKGDVNGDGLVNVVDVQLAVNQFLGVAPQTPSADLNGDGVVNVIDGNSSALRNTREVKSNHRLSRFFR